MFKSYKAMQRLLHRHGCEHVRNGANHALWKNPKTGQRILLSYGGVKTRRVYLNILKQAGIEDEGVP